MEDAAEDEVSYASVDEFREWTGHLADSIERLNPAQIQALLDRATDDLDRFLHWPPPDVPDPLPPGWFAKGRIRWLDPYAKWALAKACVEQAVYRLLRDETELSEGASSITAAGGVSFSTVAPDLVGPQAKAAMAGVPALWPYCHGLGTPDEL